MIIRQLKPNQFEYLQKDLMKRAHAKPLEASYTVSMVISGVEYSISDTAGDITLEWQFYKHSGLTGVKNGPNFELITSGNILSSLLEILIYQGVR